MLASETKYYTEGRLTHARHGAHDPAPEVIAGSHDKQKARMPAMDASEKTLTAKKERDFSKGKGKRVWGSLGFHDIMSRGGRLDNLGTLRATTLALNQTAALFPLQLLLFSPCLQPTNRPFTASLQHRWRGLLGSYLGGV